MVLPVQCFMSKQGLCALDVNENTYLSIVVPTLLEKIPDRVRLMITRGEDYLNWTVKDAIMNTTGRMRSQSNQKTVPNQ